MEITRAKIGAMLVNIGMHPHLSGFDMCAEAIYIAAKEPNAIKRMTTRIYPGVAEKFDTTPSRAERNIRHAIESLYDLTDKEQIQMYTPIPCSGNGKPTNSMFIAAMARYIRDEVAT